MPTGAGKTNTASAIIELYDYYIHGGRHLFLVQSKNLLYQTANHFRHTNPSLLPISLVGDGHKGYHGKVVVAITQSGAYSVDHVLRLCHKPFDTITVDECHHGITPQHMLIINTAIAMNPNVRILGLTATPFRFDRRGLRELFKTVPTVVQARYLHKKKLLATPRYVWSKSKDQKELVGLWQKYASNRKTLAFCDTIEEAWQIHRRFNRLGVKVGVVTGSTPYSMRLWQEEHAQVIVNCGVYTEGRDAPEIGCVLLFNRPWRERYIQMIGRGLRPDTRDCVIIGCKHYDALAHVSKDGVLGVERPLSNRAKRPQWLARLKVWLTNWRNVMSGSPILQGKGWNLSAKEAKQDPASLVEELARLVTLTHQGTGNKPTVIVFHESVMDTIWPAVENWCNATGLKRLENGDNRVPKMSVGMNLWIGIPKDVEVAKQRPIRSKDIESEVDEDEDGWQVSDDGREWSVRIKEVYTPDDELHLLFQFAKNKQDLYIYYDVDPDDVTALIDGDDPGSYYNKYIKGAYNGDKIDASDVDALVERLMSGG